MLRNPAYRGQAAYGKTKTADRHGGPTRTTRQRGERHGRRLTRADQPAEQWTLIPVAPLITEETFALAQERLVDNAHFAKRNTKELTLLQGVLVCRECGYSCYRTSTRTSNKRISYYRCIGQDGWRHPDGKRCHEPPGPRRRARPARLGTRSAGCSRTPRSSAPRSTAASHALRTEHPAARRREALERDLTRASQRDRAADRGLPRTADLARGAPRPDARPAQAPDHAPSPARRLDAELHDAETYLKLADTLEGFLGRLTDGLDQLDTRPDSNASCGSSSAKS